MKDDSDILMARANHPDGILWYERIKQDRRIYYRLYQGGRHWGSLTDAKHARETIEYWKSRGWL